MTDTVRVPREPTPEMERAGADCKSSDAAAIYRAMLAASPRAIVAKHATPPAEPEWITHHGGPNPVPGQDVRCRIRSGSVDRNPFKSDLARWEHEGSPTDIIAYRVTEGVKP